MQTLNKLNIFWRGQEINCKPVFGAEAKILLASPRKVKMCYLQDSFAFFTDNIGAPTEQEGKELFCFGAALVKGGF